MNRARVVDALTVAGVLAALAVSGLVVGREFFPERFRAARPEPAPPAPRRTLAEPGLAERLASTGWHSGEAQGADAVTIVEFSDFQCPACGATAEVLRALLREQPGKVALAYHHFPIERTHPRAFDAGVAFECARDQGRAQAMHDLLFRGQDRIPGARWWEFAAAAGVPDRGRFEACLGDPAVQARVREDAAMARALGMRGTPTLVIGREMVFGGIGADSLGALLRAARSR